MAAAMSLDKHEALEELCRSIPALEQTSKWGYDEPEAMTINRILDSTEHLDISHGGREFLDLAHGIMGDFMKFKTCENTRACQDNRTRRDHILQRTEAFRCQLDAMTSAYLQWCAGVHVQLAVFSASTAHVSGAEKIGFAMKPYDNFVASALVHQGIIPYSPITPTVVITIRALELYRVSYYHNPHFSIQAYYEFRRYLSSQFSIAFDVYLQLTASVDSLVDKVLHCNSPNWHLKHCCLACMYTLEGEQPLQFSILYALDGNDSLKCIQHNLLSEDGEGQSASIELPTCQVLTCDRYLSREFVDQYASQDVVSMVQNEDSEVNPCASHWKNMDDQKTKKTWGVYDETRIILAVCRHGFSLFMVDMVQSGELAKYPLAIISKLLEVFGKDLGRGYDIGCQFKTMLNQSPLGPLACSLNHTCLVGAFHGHAHRHLCQLDHLTMYTKGLGLEDLETCERTFSKSNALMSTVRYASAFHQKQAILGYFKHNDDYEVYANLSKFLYNNYKQALDTIHECEATLPGLMKEQNVPNEHVFEKWLAEEKAYLEQLSHEPPEETLQMEYWEQLVKLTATLQRHVLENYEKDLACMQELERKLNIDIRWKLEDAEWQCTGRLVANREYQRALDHLKGLVVARIFELSKMNRAGTAIRAALDHYNTAAHTMNPPRHQLHWDEVVKYAFLSEFNLLRDSRQDISWQPWTTPTAHLMMDWYFKKCRALEEVQCLNVKIHCFITYIQDEDRYLCRCEEQLRATHGLLAHQISIRRNVHGHFDTLHLKHLYNILQLRGFNGTLAPGISALKATGDTTDTVDELEEEEDIEENIVWAGCALQDVVHLTMDIEHTSGEE
ncbi:hypothetical protein BKA83DRAFT_4467512 [Pisolithus microcarpus]|nr:hypothetical protein BKA83DRAFT_4467512 [Pisolithus microcarpus]